MLAIDVPSSMKSDLFLADEGPSIGNILPQVRSDQKSEYLYLNMIILWS